MMYVCMNVFDIMSVDPVDNRKNPLIERVD